MAGHGTWTAPAVVCWCCPRSEGNDGQEAAHEGTADALWENAEADPGFDAGGAGRVSRRRGLWLDYAELVAEHGASGATVTLVTTTVDPDDPDATASCRPGR